MAEPAVRIKMQLRAGEDVPEYAFLELSDTPDSYVTSAGKWVRVRADFGGLEFVPPVSGEVGNQAVVGQDGGIMVKVTLDDIGAAPLSHGHPTHLTAATGDARYYRKAEVDALVAAAVAAHVSSHHT